MKRYSIFHVPVWSFFSKALYQDVCHRWKGTGFAYLLLLLAVCWIPPMIRVHIEFARFAENEAQRIIAQVPAFSIDHGKLSLSEPQPYRIVNPDTEETLVVIDTTGKTASLADANAKGLVTATQATFQKSAVETRTFSFREVEHFALNQDTIRHWLAIVERFLALGLYPFAVIGAFIGRMLQVLIYAAIGLLFASWCKSARTYLQLVRLTVVAVTPCILIKTMLGTAQVHVPSAGLLFFLCAMGFLFFGVKAAAQDDAAPAPSAPPPVPPVAAPPGGTVA